jgi:hypothetical protein
MGQSLAPPPRPTSGVPARSGDRAGCSSGVLADDEHDNPYLRAFRDQGRVWSPRAGAYHDWLRAPAGPDAFDRRVACVRRYAFGVPNAAALAALGRHGPIVELGAGTGYWAYLLRRRGVDVVAYDLAPPDRAANPYRFEPRTWVTVLPGGVEVLDRHADRALFLCWPGRDEPFADQALGAYRGATLLYVGEGRGGQTADAAFFDRLAAGWREVERVAIPCWPGTRDSLRIFRRVGGRPPAGTLDRSAASCDGRR